MIASVTEITATEIASAKFNLMADGEGDKDTHLASFNLRKTGQPATW